MNSAVGADAGFKNRLTDPELAVVLFIFALALLLRVRWAWSTLARPQEFSDVGDENLYYGMAVSLAQTGHIALNAQPTAYVMPFFSITLAPIYYFFGPDIYAPQVLIVLLSALTCVGVYFFGKDLFNAKVGLLAGLLSAVDIPLIYFSSYLLTDTLFVFLALTCLMALERLRKNQRWQWAVIAGALLGLAVLTRLNIVPFVPVVIGWLIYTGRANLKRAIRHSIVVLGLVSILWVAWIVRNYAELGAFVPFTTQSGDLYYGLYNDVVISRTDIFAYGQWRNLPLPPPPSEEPSELAWSRLLTDIAFNWIRSHPDQAVKIALMQPVHLWEPIFFVDFVLLPFLVLTSMMAVVRAVHQGNQSVILWLCLAVVFTALSIVSVGIARYRLPLHPLMAILAASTIAPKLRKLISGQMRIDRKGIAN